jgi:hypothetical protein
MVPELHYYRNMSKALRQVAELRNLATLCGYNTATPTDKGLFLYTVSTCENCGGEVQEPNGIQVYNVSPGVALAAGLRLSDTRPAELNAKDDGSYCCDNCQGVTNEQSI